MERWPTTSSSPLAPREMAEVEAEAAVVATEDEATEEDDAVSGS